MVKNMHIVCESALLIQVPYISIGFMYKQKLKDKIINNIEIARAELSTKCRALCNCTGFMPMKPTLYDQQNTVKMVFDC